MIVSSETASLSEKINDYSGKEISNLQVVAELIQLAYDNHTEDLFEKIIFTSKYITGLTKIINRTNQFTGLNGDSGAEKINGEYRNNLIEIVSLLNKLTADSNDDWNFNSQYLGLNQESFNNLSSLIKDLSWVKKYYNTQNRK